MKYRVFLKDIPKIFLSRIPANLNIGELYVTEWLNSKNVILKKFDLTEEDTDEITNACNKRYTGTLALVCNETEYNFVKPIFNFLDNIGITINKKLKPFSYGSNYFSRLEPKVELTEEELFYLALKTGEEIKNVQKI